MRSHSCLSYSSTTKHMTSKMAYKTIKFEKKIQYTFSESGHLCILKCSEFIRFEYLHMSLVMIKPGFRTKTQISFAVTAKLISAFVFATQIVQSLYFLSTKFQASSHLLWLYSPVCVGPGRKPRRPVFSQRGSNEKAMVPPNTL